jgi:hypothetical protein
MAIQQDKKVLEKRANSIDVKRDIWESGTMAVSIANMKRRGIPKSEAVRLSGVPYEIVDRYYRGGELAGKGEKDD